MMNDDLILRDTVIALIENFQRELCPRGHVWPTCGVRFGQR